MPRPSVQFLGGPNRSRRRAGWKSWLMGSALIAGLGVLGFLWWRHRTPPPRTTAIVTPSLSNAPTAVVPEPRPVAVPAPASPAVIPHTVNPAARPAAPVTNRISTPPASPASIATRGTASNPPAVRPAPAPFSIGTNQPPAATNPVFGTTATNQPVVTGVNSNQWFLPATNRIAIQIALAARGISSGSIDGLAGGQTESALRAYQVQQGLPETGRPDTATLARLQPAGLRLATRRISDADIARPRPVPTTWIGRSQATRLEFESVLEMIAEESQSHPRMIRQLNPTIDFERLRPGTLVTIPRIEVPATRRLASIRINLGQRWLRAYDDQGTLRLHFPCSIGRIAEKRPVGTLQVMVTVKDPNYTFDPAVFPESAEAREIRTKLILPAGPNNPVGVAWIGLNRPGFGIHGTPSPEQVGRTESHGCFRLANWNAELLRRCVAPGTPVLVDP